MTKYINKYYYNWELHKTKSNKLILNWIEYILWEEQWWALKGINKLMLNWIEYIFWGQWWWKPWANTVAYYKFDWNLNDDSGNWNNAYMWRWTESYTQWVLNECFNVDDSNACVSPLNLWDIFNQEFTLSFFFKTNNTDWLSRIMWWQGWNNSLSLDIQTEFYADFSWFQLYHYRNWWAVRIAFPMATTAWKWNHIVLTWDWVNQIKCYIDWVQTDAYPDYNTTFNYDVSYDQNLNLWRNAWSSVDWSWWWLDEVIIENKQWTLEDVTNYRANNIWL